MECKEDKISRDNEQNLVQKLRQWQSVEDEAMQMTREIQIRTENPLIRLVMEIIAHDSAMHRRVQQFIIDSIEKKPALQLEDLEDFRDIIDKHIERERSAIAMAEKAKEGIDLFVPRYLFSYLLEDERKHDLLLERFEEIRDSHPAT
jgi:rubrerythrin